MDGRTAVGLGGGGLLAATAVAVETVDPLPAPMGAPVWYALVGACLLFWIAMVVWASGRPAE